MKELIPDPALLTPLVKKMTALVEKQQNEVKYETFHYQEHQHKIPRLIFNTDSY